MKRIILICLLVVPGAALAAAGGVGEGFGADDWLRKWPVLAIVFLAVAGMTGFLTVKIFSRKRRGETS